MRLTIINQFYVPDISPTAHLAASLAEHRADLGDDVTVITSRGGYVEASEDTGSEVRENLKIRRLWTPRLGKSNILKRCIDYGVFYLLALLHAVTLRRQDVIVSLTTPPYIAWTAAIHKLLHRRAKLVLWNMDCYPELAERSGKLKDHGIAAQVMRFLNRGLMRRVDHLVCLDTAMVELLMSQYAPKGRDMPVTVLPNWERASFFPTSPSPDGWRENESLGLEGRFVVLYLGNMGYGHRFETVLDAAEQLADDDIVFLFIGGGAKFTEMSTEVRRRGLGNVIMHGYVPKDETPAVMACADCALITLRDEILGVMSPSKLHSNLAMRLPVIYIGPEKSNVDDAISQHSCGISLRHGDSTEMVKFVRELAADRDQLEGFRNKAREAFDAGYNDRATLPRFDSILEGLLQGDQQSGEDEAHNVWAAE